MKINKKLSEIGFSEDTINSLTESQIDQILGLLLGGSKKENKEATTKTETVKITDYSASEVAAMKQKGQGVNVSNGEVTPTPDGGVRVLQKSGKSEAPKNKVIKDGEMAEGKKKSKKKSYNPWAICTSSVGRKDMKKYERCVMDVKKSIKEGKNPYEVILERQILSLMERELHPRMTKAELLKTISEKKKEVVIIDEAEPAPAPVKPDVKPDTDRKPRRRPGQVPGPDPAPKAKSPEEKKKKYMSLISKILRDEE